MPALLAPFLCYIISTKHNYLKIMKTQLKDLYGKRITPGVKIFMLVAIIFLGMHLAFKGASDADKSHTEKTMVE
jgi:hypothetical protein